VKPHPNLLRIIHFAHAAEKPGSSSGSFALRKQESCAFLRGALETGTVHAWKSAACGGGMKPEA
jgi:hypothetical protein